jgi:hypothetical protein
MQKNAREEEDRLVTDKQQAKVDMRKAARSTVGHDVARHCKPAQEKEAREDKKNAGRN